MLPAKKVERAEAASSKFNLYMYLCKSMKYVCCEKNERGWGGVGWSPLDATFLRGRGCTRTYINSVCTSN